SWTFSRKIQTVYSRLVMIKDKIILITGATSGIGLALCKYLLENNCRVIAVGRDEDKIENAIPSPVANTTDSLLKRNAEYLKWYSLVKMEEHSINRRYNQGGVLLMSRIYIKYLGFFTGMILAIVGSVFIISKLKEDVSELEGSIQDKTKFKLISSSPGIIFGVLGTALMMTTILTHSEISVKDMPLYLNTYNISETQKFREAPKKEIKNSKINPKAVEEFEMENDSTAK
ncbi:MAG: SDR family NAD(P)-dependent oxidoreductase, partial [Ginsengibacter sp.]